MCIRYTFVCIYVSLYMYTCSYIHPYTHTYILIHIHTHIKAERLNVPSITERVVGVVLVPLPLTP